LLFKTEYCSTCPGVKRQINELIKNDEGISFYEVDAVERIELAKKLHVKSSPTVLFFNEAGLEEGRIIGAPKKDQLRNTLEKITTIKWRKQMQIDARGPRFGAAITLVVLLLVITLKALFCLQSKL